MTRHGSAGVVLTGGASTRMGADKALLTVEGRPMSVRVADALWAAGCRPVWCQGGDLEALASLGFDAVADRWPGEGPLAAIESALAHAAGADIVVAACDLFELDPDTVRSIIAAAADHAPGRVDVVVARSDGRDHVLSWWSAACAPRLADLVNRGVRSYRTGLDELSAARIEVPGSAVRNANHPGDLPS